MRTAFRSTALAAALAVVSCGAMAEKIDFESFWGATVDAGAAPTAVGVKDARVKGFLFSEGTAWAYRKEMLNPSLDVLPDVWESPGTCKPPVGADPDVVCNNSGFIMNKTRRTGDGSVIDISLDPTVFGGRFITSITLDLFHNAANGKLFVLDANGNALGDFDGFPPGTRVWREWRADLDLIKNPKFATATTLRFNFGGHALALDNLNFTLSAAVPPPPPGVPEPGSYAQVGLALLAACAARRRKA